MSDFPRQIFTNALKIETAHNEPEYIKIYIFGNFYVVIAILYYLIVNSICVVSVFYCHKKTFLIREIVELTHLKKL